ncbi:MAG: DUF1501 domain-containing protein [Planctomycetaceae bacterium]|nr:DUF1501 domain-containing protein [Planctomycetaceae bacterium]MCB9951428.1 DUF1501 domain-containing protein [Planctomycetaceae bacterium]
MMNGWLNRREMLRQAGAGFGALALAGMCQSATAAEAGIVGPHFQPRARRVIYLFMHGGPSQVDTFDYKPRLQAESGNDLPFDPGPNLDAKTIKLLGSPWKFSQHGESGQWVSELFPHVAKHVDKLCIINSMHTKGVSHGQAVSMMHTGSDSLVRPSVGAWVNYGLGTENSDLPGFVSIAPAKGHGGPRNYGSAFLPATCQATTLGHSTDPISKAAIAHLESNVSTEQQRRQLELLQSMNRDHLQRAEHDDRLEGVISSFELAFRMQSAVPHVMDLADESKETLSLYGMDESETENFGRGCLLARRFAEAGVRYIQVSYKQNAWDQHGGLRNGHTKNSLAVDKPIAGLLTDLEQRGLLDDTLVMWGGEFGRTPIVQGNDGRDHNPQGFSVWLAGGGVKGGLRYGATDDYGYYAVENKVHTHDLHATLLHLLGVDHLRLTYRHAGRDFRLTDIYGDVVHDILA